MLVFGHVGIALGATKLLSGLLGSKRISKAAEGETANPPLLRKSRLDIRFLLIGSLLPDIIDKPIGLYFFRETFSNGRIFCHTLLFLILVTVIGLYFYKRSGKTWALALSLGIFFHLTLDQMWLTPQTLLWPLFGLDFKRVDLSDWVTNIFQALLTEPAVYLPELIGAAILIWFTWTLLYRKKTRAFLKYGKS